jgi:mono/diheme cytochrome c family protein
MRQWLGCALALCLLGLGGCMPEVAGGRADGKAIFTEICARCHGMEGTPEETMAKQLGVRNLRDAAFQAGISDADLRARIAQGSANRRMPAFEGALSPAQIDAVAAHVRTLVAQPAGR